MTVVAMRFIKTAMTTHEPLAQHGFALLLGRRRLVGSRRIHGCISESNLGLDFLVFLNLSFFQVFVR